MLCRLKYLLECPEASADNKETIVVGRKKWVDSPWERLPYIRFPFRPIQKV